MNATTSSSVPLCDTCSQDVVSTALGAATTCSFGCVSAAAATSAPSLLACAG